MKSFLTLCLVSIALLAVPGAASAAERTGVPATEACLDGIKQAVAEAPSGGSIAEGLRSLRRHAVEPCDLPIPDGEGTDPGPMSGGQPALPRAVLGLGKAVPKCQQNQGSGHNYLKVVLRYDDGRETVLTDWSEQSNGHIGMTRATDPYWPFLVDGQGPLTGLTVEFSQDQWVDVAVARIGGVAFYAFDPTFGGSCGEVQFNTPHAPDSHAYLACSGWAEGNLTGQVPSVPGAEGLGGGAAGDIPDVELHIRTELRTAQVCYNEWDPQNGVP